MTETSIELYPFNYLEAYSWQQKLIEPCERAGIRIELPSDVEIVKKEYAHLSHEIAFQGLLFIKFRPAFFTDTHSLPDFTFIQLLNDSLNDLKIAFREAEGKDFMAEFSPNNLLLSFIISDDIILTGRFSLAWDKMVQEKAWSDITTKIAGIKAAEEEILKWVNSIHVQKDNVRYIYYDLQEQSWQLFDRLLQAAERLGKHFMEQKKDSRMHKSTIVFNEDDYSQHFRLGKQWQLKMEKLTLITTKPNDVALYVQLADKNAQKAKKLFNTELSQRMKQYSSPMLRPEEILAYYDYFELVIAAVIFSYTALETLANICIPEEFEFIELREKEGFKTIYSKEGIERKFPLRDKFRKVLPEILQCPDASNEPWWDKFIQLEDIRNETVHTKQSKSQDRYSLFLSKRIYELIAVTRVIITYYGSYINQNRRDLLILFPFDFGFDSVMPALMDSNEYSSHRRRLSGLE